MNIFADIPAMTTSFLTIDAPDKPIVVSEWENLKLSHDYPFPLDSFQKHAILAIEKEQNILCTATTSSGKTLIAEYLIHKIFNNSQEGRIFYLNPIKSLSNQKYSEMKKIFGANAVGLFTGDCKFNPDARIVVMTTEILRNLLMKQNSSTEQFGITASISLKHLMGVIIDEVHYILDPERGHVWEEILILLPPEIQLVMLSATLSEADKFAEWVGSLKQRPITLVQTTHRVVPLTHGILDGKKFLSVLDADTTFHADIYRNWYDGLHKKIRDHEKFQQKVRAQRHLGVEGAIDGKVRVESFSARLNSTIETLEQQNMLPAMFVAFSRKACEVYADTVQATLVDSSDSAAIRHIWDFHLHAYKELSTFPQAIKLRALVERGIGYHHSGLLPVLKEIVEVLYQRGLICIVFSTETLVTGLNTPTRTIVLVSLEKYTDGGRRFLTPAEYLQIAGRAGRRGIDTQGYCLYLPEREPVDVAQLRAVLCGGASTFTSRMLFGYEFILKALHTKATTWQELLKNSYWSHQQQRECAAAETRLEELNAQYAAFSETDLMAIDKRDELEERVRSTANATRREAQRVLGLFQNTHLGARWETLWKQRPAIRKLRTQIQDERMNIAAIRHFKDERILPLFQFLTDHGYITKDGALTTKGTMSTEVNEGHPLLMTELYLGKFCETLKTQDEILTLLTGFMTEDEKGDMPPIPFETLDIPSTVVDVGYAFGETINALMDTEAKYVISSQPAFWNMSTMWAEPIWKWLNGVGMPTLCAEYMMYEGNVTRALLKLANIAEEWITLATLNNDVAMLQKMHGAVERIRCTGGLISGESLYLRL